MNKQLTMAALLALALPLGAADDKTKPGYKDTPLIPGTKWHVHDSDRPQPKVVAPGKTFSLEAPAPSDAIVLFDGTDFSKWKGTKGDVQWKIENGYAETTKSGVIRTKDEFGDFQLHIEWATPAKVEGSGQGRGNNGLNIFGRYEIQILDSYNNPTYADGQASAIYGQYPPLVNASKPPGEWQSYDVIFEAPLWDADGKLAKKAYVTVLHNGVVVHHRQELFGNSSHRGTPAYGKRQEKGYIELYEHGNPVRFRNIWIRPLGEYDKP
ncbi:MAG TPA: DUF1080 domain-containing protein [Methylomirabilota bacterium]|nr:DUF1080 domain-containing protein [Methylomirabilota bacterium]